MTEPVKSAQISSRVLSDLNTIITAAADDAVKIKESFFKGMILPMLLDESDNASYDLWLKVAGSYSRPIDVRDDVTGEHLFRVPALVSSTRPSGETMDGRSAHDIVREAERKMITSPRAGLEHIKRNLKNLVIPNNSLVESIRAWNAIYTRYNVTDHIVDIDKLLAGEDSSSTDTASTQSGEPEFHGYDDA